MKDGARGLVGRRITGVLLKEAEGRIGPKSQLFLVLDGTHYYEFYSDSEIRMTGGLDEGGADDAWRYMASAHRRTTFVALQDKEMQARLERELAGREAAPDADELRGRVGGNGTESRAPTAESAGSKPAKSAGSLAATHLYSVVWLGSRGGQREVYQGRDEADAREAFEKAFQRATARGELRLIALSLAGEAPRILGDATVLPIEKRRRRRRSSSGSSARREPPNLVRKRLARVVVRSQEVGGSKKPDESDS